MTLPPTLQTGIDELLRGVGAQELERASRALSDAYRAGGPSAARAARTPVDVAAYLATRAPATYAAAAEVFAQISTLRPDWAPASVLDLGAGPGIASWAALEAWRAITAVTCIEAEPAMARAGTTLAAHGQEGLRQAIWTVSDAGMAGARADLVVVSYVIGELKQGAREGLVRRAWERTGDTLVIVEPGTTAGYQRVLAARAAVIEAGGSTLAPCPHDTGCPLSEGDWCHFVTRLPRSRAHRLAKGADRGFEDEKFAYVALSRSTSLRPEARVIRRPDPRPGHVVLDLCTPSGAEQRTVSRHEGDVYRRARKLRWGDAY
ncbi:MAG: small ribosomal subunit Rsm22 family protein [Thermoleophilia bacterium]